MYFKATPQKIPISSIKEEDIFFKFSDENPSYVSRLKLSVAKLGIISPIIVQPLQKKYYRVVSGFKRFQAAKELNFSSIPARILRENLSIFQIISVVLLSYPRSFSLTEKVRIIRIMICLGLSPLQICEKFGSFLETENTQLVKNYTQISSYSPALLSYISAHGLSVKQALAFKGLSPREQELMVFLGTSFSIKGYDMCNMLTDLKEIAIREGKNISRIIHELGFLEVQKDPKLTRSQKINKIKNFLNTRRYPYLTQINKQLTELQRRIESTSNIKINWDQNLEKGVRLFLDTRDWNDIQEAVKNLSSEDNYILLSRFLKVYYEGLPD